VGAVQQQQPEIQPGFLIEHMPGDKLKVIPDRVDDHRFSFLKKISEDDPASVVLWDDPKLDAAVAQINAHFSQFAAGHVNRRKPAWLSPAQSDFPTISWELKAGIVVCKTMLI
jgi:hypothetical protein